MDFHTFLWRKKKEKLQYGRTPDRIVRSERTRAVRTFPCIAAVKIWRQDSRNAKIWVIPIKTCMIDDWVNVKLPTLQLQPHWSSYEKCERTACDNVNDLAVWCGSMQAPQWKLRYRRRQRSQDVAERGVGGVSSIEEVGEPSVCANSKRATYHVCPDNWW